MPGEIGRMFIREQQRRALIATATISKTLPWEEGAETLLPRKIKSIGGAGEGETAIRIYYMKIKENICQLYYNGKLEISVNYQNKPKNWLNEVFF